MPARTIFLLLQSLGNILSISNTYESSSSFSTLMSLFLSIIIFRSLGNGVGSFIFTSTFRSLNVICLSSYGELVNDLKSSMSYRVFMVFYETILDSLVIELFLPIVEFRTVLTGESKSSSVSD